MSDDPIKDYHLEQHKKVLEMYQAGVQCGLRFAISKFISNPNPNVYKAIENLLVEEFFNEYNQGQ